jgi:hypothetical protein
LRKHTLRINILERTTVHVKIYSTWHLPDHLHEGEIWHGSQVGHRSCHRTVPQTPDIGRLDHVFQIKGEDEGRAWDSIIILDESLAQVWSN